MERRETQSSRRERFAKVVDASKRPIRRLWRRNGRFYARLRIAGKGTWVPIKAATPAEATAALNELLTQRRQSALPVLGRKPTVQAYLADTYLPRLASLEKAGHLRPATLAKLTRILNRWAAEVGAIRLNELQPRHVRAVTDKLLAEGLSGRTAELYVIGIRGLLKDARTDGHLATLPTESLRRLKSDPPVRRFYSVAEIDRLSECCTGKAGDLMRELIGFLRYSGARIQEALSLRWEDVDFERRHVRFGAATTKGRATRFVDWNPALEAHLRDMATRRRSEWLFPSPHRTGERASNLYASLGEAAKKAGLEGFGFHDLRHHFASLAVMNGVDFMTLARWLGHADGGVLIGKVYGHLADDHAKRQADRLNLGLRIEVAA